MHCPQGLPHVSQGNWWNSAKHHRLDPERNFKYDLDPWSMRMWKVLWQSPLKLIKELPWLRKRWNLRKLKTRLNLLKSKKFLNPQRTAYFCYNCDIEGHFARECPFEKPQYYCYKCGGEGHFARHLETPAGVDYQLIILAGLLDITSAEQSYTWFLKIFMKLFHSQN